MRISITTVLLTVLSTSAFAQPGTLDPTFGTGGVVQINMTGNLDTGTDMLPMADGRLWVCGYQSPSSTLPEPFLLRLLPDGTLDPDYGTVILSHGANGRAERMVYAADSSIYLCGYADTLGYERYTLWHVLPDGTPDAAFGLNGRVSFPLTGIYDFRASDIAIQPDGKLVVAGYRRISTRMSFVARFNTDGTLDSTFGFNGLLTMDNSESANDEFLSVDVLDDGSIVAGGYGKNGLLDYPLIVKLTPLGVPDVSFDGDGILVPTLSCSEARVHCLAAVGQTVVAGGSRYTGISTTSDYFLILLDDTGALDPTFGTLGEEVTDVDADDYIRDLILLSDGRFAVAGYTGNMTNGVGYIDFLTSVHTSNGALYSPFGGNGYAIGAVSTSVEEGYAVKVQSDGKLVVCGVGNSGNVIILRYENDVNTLVASSAQETGLFVWPNPASDHLQLRTVDNGAAHVEIMDATGRIVRDLRTTNASSMLIPVADLQPGSYVLRCAEGEVVRTSAFVIAR